MTKPELPRCACGKQLTRHDIARGFASCGIKCALKAQRRLLDMMRADEPTDDEVLDGLLALKREEEAKR